MKVILILGVSGSGKTTVGRRLAEALGGEFLDADDFHPESSRRKMEAGLPLDDADRVPWIDRLIRELSRRRDAGHPLVLACSALKERYRERFRERLPDIRFVHLRGDYATIVERMRQRKHFFGPDLLKSQFDALEEPAGAIAVPVDQPVDKIVADIMRALP